MKKAIIALFCMAALAGCSPKSTAIPTDSSKWDTLAPDVKRLNEEDRRLFAAYMARQGIASALSQGKVTVPVGMTIGKAIDDQKKFEADQKKAEAEAELVRAKAIAARAAAEKAMSDAAVLSIVQTKLIPENIYASRYSDQFALVIAVQNKSAKNISGIKGMVEFSDIFGAQIKSVQLSLSENIPAGKLETFSSYALDLNQFDDADNKLKNTDPAKIKAVFHPQMIVFSDGTDMKAPDVPQ